MDVTVEPTTDDVYEFHYSIPFVRVISGLVVHETVICVKSMYQVELTPFVSFQFLLETPLRLLLQLHPH